jgi:hypothetical protein
MRRERARLRMPRAPAAMWDRVAVSDVVLQPPAPPASALEVYVPADQISRCRRAADVGSKKIGAMPVESMRRWGHPKNGRSGYSTGGFDASFWMSRFSSLGLGGGWHAATHS